jgi:hypothetical protein
LAWLVLLLPHYVASRRGCRSWLDNWIPRLGSVTGSFSFHQSYSLCILATTENNTNQGMIMPTEIVTKTNLTCPVCNFVEQLKIPVDS